MKPVTSHRVPYSAVDIASASEFILSLQKPNGEIPWSKGGKTDPWDHVESAMGLGVTGHLREAESAYEWLAQNQLEDGSFWSSTRNGLPEDTTRETNMAAYIAVGVFHYYLLTDDLAFVKRLWPAVKAGIDYAVGLQAPSGEIYWAKNKEGAVDPMALLAGSSSIYMSLKCALALAPLLGRSQPDWDIALKKLGEAIRYKPDCFNMIKSRFSMDWYYPILCGAVSGNEARKRIDKFWDKFAVPNWGVRCVSDRPWVTMAETSELVLALAAIDDFDRAKMVFSWLLDKKYEDGSYWMGVTFPDAVIWPEEKTSWTAAAVLLAYDALNELTPASGLFNHGFWHSSETGASPRFEFASVRTVSGRD